MEGVESRETGTGMRLRVCAWVVWWTVSAPGESPSLGLDAAGTFVSLAIQAQSSVAIVMVLCINTPMRAPACLSGGRSGPLAGCWTRAVWNYSPSSEASVGLAQCTNAPSFERHKPVAEMRKIT